MKNSNLKSWGNLYHDIHNEYNSSYNSSFLDIGNLNSYGDCCIPLNSISNVPKNSVVNDTVYNYQIKHGYYLYGTPGKSDVTIAGAIASDTHGKDNNWGGSFYKNVKKIFLSIYGEEIETSREKDVELFNATIGGYGLTGTIKNVELFENNVKISENYETFIETGFGIDNLLNSFSALEKEYWVGWINLHNKNFPWVTNKSISSNKPIKIHNQKKDFELHASFPFIGRNKFKALNLINFFYFQTNKFLKTGEKSFYKTFFPLSFISDTRNISKSRKIVQVQFSIPSSKSYLLEPLLKMLVNKQIPLLCSIKKLSNQDCLNNLSFYQEGWTIAVDFSFHQFNSQEIEKFYKELSKLGGKVYLAKDSTLDKKNFRSMYPESFEWEKIVKSVDPKNLYQSKLSNRLGLKGW
ncbi:MAG: hypothetical protein VW827_06775 [Alphaproteobacteria bacterium]